MQCNVYRVWFDPVDGGDYGVCCILVSTTSEKRALELAREQVKDFPVLQNAQYQIDIFDTNSEHASICS